MDQLTFTNEVQCSQFMLNKTRLNMKNAKVTCRDCGATIAAHSADTVSEADVMAYLSHLEGSDGGNCIVDGSSDGLGSMYCGARGVSLRAFVEKHNIGAVCNASNLHLQQRSDFQTWAKKVEDLEAEKLIEVLRIGWSDDHQQELTGLLPAVVWCREKILAGVNVAVHCAQGKSRSGAVVVSYLMATGRVSYEEALAAAQLKRNIILPNEAFARQIKEQTAALHQLL